MYRLSLAIVAVWLMSFAVSSANESIGALIPGEGPGTRHPVLSIRERSFTGIVRQQTDFSCGAAVLATIFQDGYGAPVTEADVLKGMLNLTNPITVRERGFSLLDIKNYARAVGLSAEGYDLSIAALRDLRVPAIVLIDVRGYHHFSVLRRVDARYAYLADPALGNTALPVQDFEREWSGVVLVVLGQGYKNDNVLSRVAPPLDSSHLYLSAPVALTPAAQAAITFTGVTGAQRL
ncbi:MAG: C39 family peptidase [Candidatus Velthaea sp.]